MKPLEIPKQLDVASGQFGETLKADCLADGLLFHIKYPSGKEFPSPFRCRATWAEWDYLVAWVELQRRENALSPTT